MNWPSTLVLGLTVIISLHYIRKKRRPPLPPGPRGLPFFGNVFDVPTGNHSVKWAEIGDVWGDISSLTAFGHTMIIVNSVKIAEDLLDVRGANFSDRPVLPMGGKLTGFDNGLPLSHYGDRVRKERKLFHQLFGTQAAIKQFIPLLSTEIHNLLRGIVLNPGKLIEEIERSTGAIALRIAYGYRLCDGPDQDAFFEMFKTMGHHFSILTTPAAFLVDIIPLCRYWPEWLPGGGFHTTARVWSKQLYDTIDAGLEYVKKEMAAGTAETSFLSTLLEEKRHEDHLIKWAAATIEVGGSDTTAAQLEAFLLAMTLYPDVQAAAQKEIDAVIGNDRLPDISDRTQLPYVDALCKEVLRWHIAGPLAVQHRAREDYIYHRGGDLESLLIPKDSIVIVNIWKMTHDPERYENPMVFNPSRFIATEGKEAEQDPARICFGYGRRICPGRLLGDTTVFMGCSAILSVFNISKARENGVVVEPHVGHTSATVSHVLPFKCVVEPRNARALALIHSG
ncbi:cytochrome P450 [Mycena pura]|uniref:Cytochrome P450 n=1 Tax=Mycena pura TaxID=153505 RepID=A0AAD6VI22_9AGAR|nr:cytochrome P450 [Mycena pura]